MDRKERKKKKMKCCICSMKHLPSRETPCNRFFFLDFTEMVCGDTYSSIEV